MLTVQDKKLLETKQSYYIYNEGYGNYVQLF